ncbi:MAG TPA: transposase [Pararobbsia sp.]|jgi:transposase|nr:transposase [Pararobbsia sp.]
MAKYDEKFKLQVVQSYVQGRRGFKDVANQYGLDYGMVRRWIKAHEQHGPDGLRKKFGHYSARFKLSVLRWMWKEDRSANQAIARFDIRGGVSVIKDWARRYDEGGLDALKPKPRGRTKKMTTPKRLNSPDFLFNDQSHPYTDT